MNAGYAFDLVLAALMVGLAMFTLYQRRPVESVAQFMLFGLVLSLSWVRVDAPDLALAEAAIGSGVTGALLLGALRRMGAQHPKSLEAPARLRLPVTLGCCILACLLSLVLIEAWPAPVGLTAQVHAALPQSGVSNPVTAVILNFRGYDTLLEIAVLLAAALGVYALSDQTPEKAPGGSGPILSFYLHGLRPFFVLVALYLVWVGGHAPGGAFQAGALLAGLGVVCMVSANPWPIALRRRLTRWGLVCGLLTFLVAAALLWSQGGLLAYPPGQAKHWILVIELACTLSIGLTLTALFAACAGWLDGGGTEES